MSDHTSTSQDVEIEIESPVEREISTAIKEQPRLKLKLAFADGISVVVALLVAFTVQRVFRPIPQDLAFEHLALAAASIPGFAFGAFVSRLYLARANERTSQEAGNVLRAVMTGMAGLVLIAFLFQFKDLSRLWVASFGLCAVGALLIERQLARRVFARMRATGRLSRPILIIGTDAHAIGLLHTYQRNPELGYQVVGFIGDDDLGERAGVRVLGSIADLPDVLAANDLIVGVVVSLASVGHDNVNMITRRLTDDGYHVALSSLLTDIDVTRLRPQEFAGRTMLYVEPVVRGGWRAVAKRTFDIAVAVTVLSLSAPIWIIAMIAIKLDGPGPIMFRQERVGRYGESFTMTKLRTMVVGAHKMKAGLEDQNEADGPLFKMEDDPRITRVGRFLRKYSIDELPQLVAVIRGEMSMVGPRPALLEEVEEWDPSVRERLRVLPGLTGLWQVSGRSSTSFEQYKRLDLYYVDNWSLAHDLRICIRTIGAVVSRRGAA